MYICGSSEWKLFHVILTAPRISTYLWDLFKNLCTPAISDTVHSRFECVAYMALVYCSWDRGWVPILGFYSWDCFYKTPWLWLSTVLQFSVIPLRSLVPPFPFPLLVPNIKWHILQSVHNFVKWFFFLQISLYWYRIYS